MSTRLPSLAEMARNMGGSSGTFYVVLWFPPTHYQS